MTFFEFVTKTLQGVAESSSILKFYPQTVIVLPHRGLLDEMKAIVRHKTTTLQNLVRHDASSKVRDKLDKNHVICS